MSKHWTADEYQLLSAHLSDGISLSDLQMFIPSRTQGAVKVQASKVGFRAKTIDGNTLLFDGIKRREKQDNLYSDEDVISSELSGVIDNNSSQIIPLLSNSDGEEVTILALKLLKDYDLRITPKAVKKVLNLLLKHKRKPHE